MNYQKKEIKKGIEFHTIKTEKFKTNLLALFITTPITRENVTKTAMLPAILRRGSKNMKTIEEISIKLEEMYGASFDCGVEKIGDNQVIKFYLESLNDTYLPENSENILEKSIETILEIALNPYTEGGHFKAEYVESEKENLKQIIEGKKDNKAQYALERCIEEMYQDLPYGLYKYGYVEDLEKINAENLYEYYLDLLSECKMDFFISGDIKEEVLEQIKKNENIQKLNPREAIYQLGSEKEKKESEEKEVEESMDIAQGKLVIGMDVKENEKQTKYVALVYNAILGGTPTSKLFQNVREKASLAYTASSNYAKQKNNIFIRCGIEIDNYDKAVEIIKQQLEDMKQGNISEEEIESAKTNIMATIKFIPDEQDTAITYYFGQELSEFKMKFEEYEENIKKITKEQIVDLANKVEINTIYFLKN